MTIQLTMGEKKPLSAIGVGQRFTVTVDHGTDGGAHDLDVALFSLDANQKIGDDRYTALFSQPETPGGEIRMTTPVVGTTQFEIDLSRLPPAIERMVLTATHDTMPVSRALPLVVSVGDASFDVGRFIKQEKAVKLVEFYRHKGEWRIGAVAQGFNGGLADLVEHFGGEVDGARSSGAPMQQTSAPAPSPAPAPAPTPAPKKVSLAKKQSVSLAKPADSFGEIFLNLNWTQPKGMFSRSVDLDLGCIFELANGRCGVVQALGRSFGNYTSEPYMELSGDDRTGAIASGETIRVNGRHFQQIRRMAVFALIYDGIPNWDASDAVITIKMPSQPEIEVRMTGGDNRRRLCGVALIENVDGQMRITSLNDYHENQEGYSDSLRFPIRWHAATKD